jgi:hypothetical protein
MGICNGNYYYLKKIKLLRPTILKLKNDEFSRPIQWTKMTFFFFGFLDKIRDIQSKLGFNVFTMKR